MELDLLPTLVKLCRKRDSRLTGTVINEGYR
jgi:hypothetical protein